MNNSCILTPLYGYNYEICQSQYIEFPTSVIYTIDASFAVLLFTLFVYGILPVYKKKEEINEFEDLEDEEYFTPQCWV